MEVAVPTAPMRCIVVPGWQLCDDGPCVHRDSLLFPQVRHLHHRTPRGVETAFLGALGNDVQTHRAARALPPGEPTDVTLPLAPW